MTIELVTGVPGAGKTLYTLAKKVRPLVGSKITLNDVTDPQTGKPLEVERRLMVSGVRDLLLPHEIVDVAPSHEPWENEQRSPGEPPRDVPHFVQNWWLWCKPGDVIVVDECQRVFRPAAAGQKIPAFIRHLETHRHYGVDFIVVTQHPQLIHANVRNLIGHHEHVRRIFGGAGTMVYEWDHCTHPDRTKQATGRLWRHDKSAFGLYKSAEVHTKVSHKIPGAVMVFAAGLLLLPFVGTFVFQRMHQRFGGAPVVAESASAPVAASAVGGSRPGVVGATASTAPAVAAAPAPAVAASAVAGCIMSASRCECIDTQGFWLTTEVARCKQNVNRSGDWIPYAVVSHGAASQRAAEAPVVASAPEISSQVGSQRGQDVAPVMAAFSDGHIRR